MERTIRRLQSGVFLFISLLGTLLHFLFDWSGGFPPLGAVSAVNESVWEHMKLLFVPMLAAAALQYSFFPEYHCGFWRVKLTGMTLGLLLIPALYYSYTGALGIHLTWLDISIFYLAAAAACLVETRLLLKKPSRCSRSSLAIIPILVIAFAFVLFTYFPPHLPIFRDPVNLRYGILP